MVRGKACSPPNTTTASPLQATSPSPLIFFTPMNTTPPLFVLLKRLSVERRALACPPPTPPPPKSLAACHWRDSVRCPKASVGEETLVNLPIACHRPRPGLFVSGTPLISPSTPSSVFPPSLLTQFLYPKTVPS